MAPNEHARKRHDELFPGHVSHRVHLLQGDRRHAGNSSDGVISRRQIAEVLVRSLTSDAATAKTFELVVETGAAQDDLDALFTALDADPIGRVDGVRDLPNMPLDEEPQRVREDLNAMLAHRLDSN